MRKILKFAKKIINKYRYNTKKCIVFMVLVCKDEEDILPVWFEFHKSMGVDGFIVTNNGSKDSTNIILEKYKQKGYIKEIINDDSKVFDQAEMCNRMIRIAKKKYHASWVISSDADEFWYANSLNIKQDIVKNKSCNILYVLTHQFVPYNSGEDFIKIPYFVNRGVLNYEKELLKLNNPFYYAPYINKCIVKTKNFIAIRDGNHDAIMFKRKECNVSNIKIYHYGIRNIKQFTRKIKNGGEGIINHPQKDHIALHWQSWYQNYYLKNKMDELWKIQFEFNRFDELLKLGIISVDYTIINFLKNNTDLFNKKIDKFN